MCKSEDNIKIDFKGIVFKDVDWIQLSLLDTPTDCSEVGI